MSRRPPKVKTSSRNPPGSHKRSYYRMVRTDVFYAWRGKQPLRRSGVPLRQHGECFLRAPASHHFRRRERAGAPFTRSARAKRRDSQAVGLTVVSITRHSDASARILRNDFFAYHSQSTGERATKWIKRRSTALGSVHPLTFPKSRHQLICPVLVRCLIQALTSNGCWRLLTLLRYTYVQDIR